MKILVATALLLNSFLLSTGMWPTLSQLGVRTIANVQLNPSGTLCFYTITDLVIKGETSLYETRLEIQRLPPRQPAQTQTSSPNIAPKVSEFYIENACTQPTWVPGAINETVAFLTNDGSIWISELDGDEFADPIIFELESAPKPFLYYTWSPDGKRFAFSAEVFGESTSYRRNIQDDVIIDVINEKPQTSKHILCIGNASIYIHPVPIYCINTLEDSVGFVPWLISCWPYGSQYAWSPDSKSLTFTKTNTSYANDWMSVGLSILNVSAVSTDLHSSITPVKGEDYSVFQPHYSPDGRHLAFVQIDKKYMVWSQAWRICVSSSDGSNAVCDKAGTYDLEPQLIGWTADSKHILYTEQKNFDMNIYSVEVNSDGSLMPYQPVEVTTRSGIIEKFAGVFSSISIQYVRSGTESSQTGLGFTYENVYVAQEGYFGYLSTGGTGGGLVIEAEPLTNVNSNFTAYSFANSTRFSYESAGGMEVDAMLISPSNVVTKKFHNTSLLVYVHPGPNMAHTSTFIGYGGVGARYPIATLAELGYYVLLPNIRGSSGYGIKYRMANYKDWGGMDYEDLVEGIRYVIDKYDVPKNRVGMLGWSYGGYLTAVALTRANELPDGIKLKAVAIGGGIVDLISHTGTADISRILRDTFGGYFWESNELKQLYEDRSPIYHIKNATAYTLINHGINDPRVPISQAYQLHYALKSQWANRVPDRLVTFVAYPKSGHIPSNPDELIDMWNSNAYWFMTFLPNDGPPGNV